MSVQFRWTQSAAQAGLAQATCHVSTRHQGRHISCCGEPHSVGIWVLHACWSCTKGHSLGDSGSAPHGRHHFLLLRRKSQGGSQPWAGKVPYSLKKEVGEEAVLPLCSGLRGDILLLTRAAEKTLIRDI